MNKAFAFARLSFVYHWKSFLTDCPHRCEKHSNRVNNYNLLRRSFILCFRPQTQQRHAAQTITRVFFALYLDYRLHLM